MNKSGWLSVMVVLGFTVLQLVSFDCRADEGGPYAEGSAVTVVVPAASLEKVETKKRQKKNDNLEQIDDYEVEVAIDGNGGLVLGGDPNWSSSSLPLVVAGDVTKIKNSRKAKKTLLTVTGDDRTISFRLPMNSAWQGPIAEVLVPGRSSVSSPSPGLEASLSRMIDAFCAEQFTGPLDALDERIRRRVAELKLAVGDTGPPTTSVFESNLYFDSDLGEGTVVYNRKTTTPNQRTASTIADRILPATKAWAKVFFGDVPFYGFRLAATIVHKDFVEYPPKSVRDEIEFYVSLDDAEDYADDDLSSQGLIDASTVVVNGKQVRLDVSFR